MTQTMTPEAAVDQLNVYWDSATSVYLMLYDATATSSPPTAAEIYAAEVPEENGYSRKAIAPVLPAEWNAATNSAERTMQNTTVGATGGTITYSAYAIVRNGTAESNKIATATSANNSFNVVGHGLNNGDRILITADATATLPSGLSGTTFYYADVTDADNFTLLDEPGGAGIGFTSDGSGTLRLRYCAGAAGWFEKLTSSRTIDPSGDPHPFTGITVFQEV